MNAGTIVMFVMIAGLVILIVVGTSSAFWDTWFDVPYKVTYIQGEEVKGYDSKCNIRKRC